jgi:hypothetical protein
MFTFVKTLLSLTNALASLMGWLKQRSLLKAGENNAVKKGLADAFSRINKARSAVSHIDRDRLRNKFRASDDS